MTKPSIQVLIETLKKARESLQFYADLRYSHKTGFPPEVQWIAENTIKDIDSVLEQELPDDKA